MSEELEQFVADLKRAAEENRALFLNSIQMLAGAVDEKDPYTRGHSDRVTRYSVMLATDLGLPEDFIEKLRISAQLHDVGKIGIEDRVLKKPGALTPEEFEIMKTHTTKGANILRPVEQLAGDAARNRTAPRVARRPRLSLWAERRRHSADGAHHRGGRHLRCHYHQSSLSDGADGAYAVRIINSLALKRLDPKVVAALTALFERGQIHVVHGSATPPPSTASPDTEIPQEVVAVVESGRT